MSRPSCRSWVNRSGADIRHLQREHLWGAVPRSLAMMNRQQEVAPRAPVSGSEGVVAARWNCLDFDEPDRSIVVSLNRTFSPKFQRRSSASA